MGGGKAMALRAGMLLILLAWPAGQTRSEPSPPGGPTSPPFMIFFDFASISVGSQQRPVLERLVALWKAGSIEGLTVAGHADAAHTADSSMDISRQRAWAVHDFFVEAGIPSEAIAVRYFGEERPLIETSDGIREPQNRRVEIWFAPVAAAVSR